MQGNANENLQTKLSGEKVGKKISLLRDRNYENGFGVMGVSGERGRENLGYFTYGGIADAKNKSVWQIGQWGGIGDLSSANETKLADGIWQYSAAGKSVTVDTKNGRISLGVDGRKEYERLRKSGECWVHNLIEQSFEESVPFGGLSHFNLTLDYSVDRCDNYCGSEYDTDVHAAQLTLYLTLNNRPTATVFNADTGEWSNGRYDDFLWFGVPIFDNRKEFQPQNAAYDDGTKSYISSIDTRNYQSEPVKTGKRYRFTYDILPEIHSAVKRAKDMGALKNVDENNMFFSYMNFGWEVPGTFDVSVTVNGLNLEID